MLNAEREYVRKGISHMGILGPADFGDRKRWSGGGVPTRVPRRRDFAVWAPDTRSMTGLENRE